MSTKFATVVEIAHTMRKIVLTDVNRSRKEGLEIGLTGPQYIHCRKQKIKSEYQVILTLNLTNILAFRCKLC